MKCSEFVEFVMEYLEGTLGESERCVFEGHIELCPPCVNYLASYRETVRLGNSICSPDDEVPNDVPEELVQAILAARKR
jgi:Predicted transmembrane transcriptional regulator (anti-sigma factor)